LVSHPELAGFDWSRFRALLETVGLDARLVTSSRYAIQEALTSAEDPTVMARLAGSATEWLAKAVIFRHEPALLATEGKHTRDKSVGYLTGAGHPEARSFADVGTLVAPDAVRLALELVGEIPPTIRQLSQEIFAARNTATHLDIVDARAAIAATDAALTYAVHLLKPFGLDHQSWIQDAGILQIALAVRQAATATKHLPALIGSVPTPTEVVLAARQWHAAQEWERMQERVEAGDLDRLSVNPRVPSDMEQADELLACPTGGHLAWFELIREDAGYDDHAAAEGETAYDLYLHYMHCGLCGLELDNSLLGEVGLGESVGYEILAEDGTTTTTMF
jgi:hypothetical protein